MDVKNYFKEYPLSQEVHQTSDGLLFHQSQDAVNHARTLEDNEVKPHYRNATPSKKTTQIGDEPSEFERHAEGEHVTEAEQQEEEAQDVAAKTSTAAAKKTTAKKAVKN